jgi:hypothetical protein
MPEIAQMFSSRVISPLSREHLAVGVVGVALLVVLGVVLFHRGGGTSAAATSPPATSTGGAAAGQRPPTATVPNMSPRRFLDRALATAKRSRDFTSAATATVGPTTVTADETAGRRTGSQTLVVADQVAEARVFRASRTCGAPRSCWTGSGTSGPRTPISPARDGSRFDRAIALTGR